RLWVLSSLLILLVGRCVLAWTAHVNPDEAARSVSFEGRICSLPQIDASGSRVLYLQTTENGIGLVASHISTGKKEILCEGPIPLDSQVPRHIVSVCPSRSVFATVTSTNISGQSACIIIRQIPSADVIGRFEMLGQIVKEMVWLNSEKL